MSLDTIMSSALALKRILWLGCLLLLLSGYPPTAAAQDGTPLPNPFELLPGNADLGSRSPAESAPQQDTQRNPAPAVDEAAVLEQAEVENEDAIVATDKPAAAVVHTPADAAARADAAAPADADTPADAAAPADADTPAVDEVAIAADAGDAVLEGRYQRAYVIDIDGPVFGRFHWFLNQRLDQAQ